MSTSLNPVSFESNFPGLVINSANAQASEVLAGPVYSNPDAEKVIGDSDKLRATLAWNFSASPPLSFVLGLTADWKTKAILQNVETGAVTTLSAIQPFTAAPNVSMQLTFGVIPPGVYRLYVTSQLQVRGTGQHLAVSMSSEGATFTVYDSVIA
jgi:hypothetical protein